MLSKIKNKKWRKFPEKCFYFEISAAWLTCYKAQLHIVSSCTEMGTLWTHKHDMFFFPCMLIEFWSWPDKMSNYKFGQVANTRWGGSIILYITLQKLVFNYWLKVEWRLRHLTWLYINLTHCILNISVHVVPFHPLLMELLPTYTAVFQSVLGSLLFAVMMISSWTVTLDVYWSSLQLSVMQSEYQDQHRKVSDEKKRSRFITRLMQEQPPHTVDSRTSTSYL